MRFEHSRVYQVGGQHWVANRRPIKCDPQINEAPSGWIFRSDRSYPFERPAFGLKIDFHSSPNELVDLVTFVGFHEESIGIGLWSEPSYIPAIARPQATAS
jgi:hypothetical protein